GLLSTATVTPWSSMTMPMVEVVPISRPSNSAILRLSQLADLVHEALDARHVDRVPGVAIDLEMGADDGAVRDRQHVRHIVEIDAGIGEDRRRRNRILHVL